MKTLPTHPLAGFLLFLPLPLIAETLSVVSSADSGTGSLRAALMSAASGDIITFAPNLDGTTITLTSGQLLIDGLEITIDASSLPAGIGVSGNGASRVVAITGPSDVTMRKITIRDGHVDSNQSGGGIFHAGGNLEMSDCVVTGCFADANGGGVNLALQTTSVFDRCRFVDNATGNVGFGGGLFIGGTSSTTLSNSVISGNRTTDQGGGGVAIVNASPVIVHCTIQGNQGGGIWNSQSNTVIRNSIVWGNSSSGNLAAQQVRNINQSQPSISHSLIQGASGSGSFNDGNSVSWGAGNLNGTLAANDPRFAAAISSATAPHEGGDLRLLAGSAAVDAGNNAASMGASDLTGNPRIQNGTADMGAFEGGYVSFAMLYPGTNPDSDASGNGLSNFEEYALGLDLAGQGSTPSAAISMIGGDKVLTFRARRNTLDVDMTWETSTDLSDWSPLEPGTHYSVLTTDIISLEMGQAVFTLLGSDPSRFYRQNFTQLD